MITHTSSIVSPPGCWIKKKLQPSSGDFKINQGQDPSESPSDSHSFPDEDQESGEPSEISLYATDSLNFPEGYPKNEGFCDRTTEDKSLDEFEIIEHPSSKDTVYEQTGIASARLDDIIASQNIEKIDQHLSFTEEHPTSKDTVHKKTGITSARPEDVISNENIEQHLSSTEVDIAEAMKEEPEPESSYQPASISVQSGCMTENIASTDFQESKDKEEYLPSIYNESNKEQVIKSDQETSKEDKETDSLEVDDFDDELNLVEEAQNIINEFCDTSFLDSFEITSSNELSSNAKNNQDLSYDSEQEWKMNEERNNSLNANFIDNKLYCVDMTISPNTAIDENSMVIATDVSIDSAHGISDQIFEASSTSDFARTVAEDDKAIKSSVDEDDNAVKSSGAEDDKAVKSSGAEDDKAVETSLAGLQDAESIKPLSVLCQTAASTIESIALSLQNLASDDGESVESQEEAIFDPECSMDDQQSQSDDSLVTSTHSSISTQIAVVSDVKIQDLEEDIFLQEKVTETSADDSLTIDTIPVSSTPENVFYDDPKDQLMKDEGDLLLDDLETDDISVDITSQNVIDVSEVRQYDAQNDIEDRALSKSIDSTMNECDDLALLSTTETDKGSGNTDESIASDKTDETLKRFEVTQESPSAAFKVEDNIKQNEDSCFPVESAEADDGNLAELTSLKSYDSFPQYSSPIGTSVEEIIVKEVVSEVQSVKEDLEESNVSDLSFPIKNEDALKTGCTESDAASESTSEENVEDSYGSLVSHFYDEWIENVKTSSTVTTMPLDVRSLYVTYGYSGSSSENSGNVSENEDMQEYKETNISKSVQYSYENKPEIVGDVVKPEILVEGSNTHVEESGILLNDVRETEVSFSNVMNTFAESQGMQAETCVERVTENFPEVSFSNVMNTLVESQELKVEIHEEKEAEKLTVEIKSELSSESEASIISLKESLKDVDFKEQRISTSKSCQTDDSFEEEDQFFDSFDDGFTDPTQIFFPLKSITVEPIRVEIGIQCCLVDTEIVSPQPSSDPKESESKKPSKMTHPKSEEVKPDVSLVEPSKSVIIPSRDSPSKESENASEDSDSDIFLEPHSSLEELAGGRRDSRARCQFLYAEVDSDTGFSSGGSEYGAQIAKKPPASSESVPPSHEKKTSKTKSKEVQLKQVSSSVSLQNKVSEHQSSSSLIDSQGSLSSTVEAEENTLSDQTEISSLSNAQKSEKDTEGEVSLDISSQKIAESLLERVVTPVLIERTPSIEDDIKFVEISDNIEEQAIAVTVYEETTKTPTVEFFYGQLPQSVSDSLPEPNELFEEALDLLESGLTEAADLEEFVDPDVSFQDDVLSDSISEYFAVPDTSSQSSESKKVEVAKKADDSIDVAKKADVPIDVAKKADAKKCVVPIDTTKKADVPVDVAKKPDVPVDVAKLPDVPVDVAKKPDVRIDVAKKADAKKPDVPVDVAKEPDVYVDAAKKVSESLPVIISSEADSTLETLKATEDLEDGDVFSDPVSTFEDFTPSVSEHFAVPDSSSQSTPAKKADVTVLAAEKVAESSPLKVSPSDNASVADPTLETTKASENLKDMDVFSDPVSTLEEEVKVLTPSVSEHFSAPDSSSPSSIAKKAPVDSAEEVAERSSSKVCVADNASVVDPTFKTSKESEDQGEAAEVAPSSVIEDRSQADIENFEEAVESISVFEAKEIHHPSEKSAKDVKLPMDIDTESRNVEAVAMSQLVAIVTSDPSNNENEIKPECPIPSSVSMQEGGDLTEQIKLENKEDTSELTKEDFVSKDSSEGVNIPDNEESDVIEVKKACPYVPAVPSDIVRYLYYDDTISFEGDSHASEEGSNLAEDPPSNAADVSIENNTFHSLIEDVPSDSKPVICSEPSIENVISDSDIKKDLAHSEIKDSKENLETKEVASAIKPPVLETDIESSEFVSSDPEIKKVQLVPEVVNMTPPEVLTADSDVKEEELELDATKETFTEELSEYFTETKSGTKEDDVPRIPEMIVDKHIRGAQVESDEVTDISTHFTMTEDDSDNFSDIESDSSLHCFEEDYASPMDDGVDNLGFSMSENAIQQSLESGIQESTDIRVVAGGFSSENIEVEKFERVWEVKENVDFQEEQNEVKAADLDAKGEETEQVVVSSEVKMADVSSSNVDQPDDGEQMKGDEIIASTVNTIESRVIVQEKEDLEKSSDHHVADSETVYSTTELEKYSDLKDNSTISSENIEKISSQTAEKPQKTCEAEEISTASPNSTEIPMHAAAADNVYIQAESAASDKDLSDTCKLEESVSDEPLFQEPNIEHSITENSFASLDVSVSALSELPPSKNNLDLKGQDADEWLDAESTSKTEENFLSPEGKAARSTDSALNDIPSALKESETNIRAPDTSDDAIEGVSDETKEELETRVPKLSPDESGIIIPADTVSPPPVSGENTGNLEKTGNLDEIVSPRCELEIVNLDDVQSLDSAAEPEPEVRTESTGLDIYETKETKTDPFPKSVESLPSDVDVTGCPLKFGSSDGAPTTPEQEARSEGSEGATTRMEMDSTAEKKLSESFTSADSLNIDVIGRNIPSQGDELLKDKETVREEIQALDSKSNVSCEAVISQELTLKTVLEQAVPFVPDAKELEMCSVEKIGGDTDVFSASQNGLKSLKDEEVISPLPEQVQEFSEVDESSGKDLSYRTLSEDESDNWFEESDTSVEDFVEEEIVPSDAKTVEEKTDVSSNKKESVSLVSQDSPLITSVEVEKTDESVENIENSINSDAWTDEKVGKSGESEEKTENESAVTDESISQIATMEVSLSDKQDVTASTEATTETPSTVLQVQTEECLEDDQNIDGLEKRAEVLGVELESITLSEIDDETLNLSHPPLESQSECSEYATADSTLRQSRLDSICSEAESNFHSLSDDTMNMTTDDDYTDVPSHMTLTENSDVWSDAGSVSLEMDELEIPNLSTEKDITPTRDEELCDFKFSLGEEVERIAKLVTKVEPESVPCDTSPSESVPSSVIATFTSDYENNNVDVTERRVEDLPTAGVESVQGSTDEKESAPESVSDLAGAKTSDLASDYENNNIEICIEQVAFPLVEKVNEADGNKEDAILKTDAAESTVSENLPTPVSLSTKEDSSVPEVPLSETKQEEAIPSTELAEERTVASNEISKTQLTCESVELTSELKEKEDEPGADATSPDASPKDLNIEVASTLTTEQFEKKTEFTSIEDTETGINRIESTTSQIDDNVKVSIEDKISGGSSSSVTPSESDGTLKDLSTQVLSVGVETEKINEHSEDLADESTASFHTITDDLDERFSDSEATSPLDDYIPTFPEEINKNLEVLSLSEEKGPESTSIFSPTDLLCDENGNQAAVSSETSVTDKEPLNENMSTIQPIDGKPPIGQELLESLIPSSVVPETPVVSEVTPSDLDIKDSLSKEATEIVNILSEELTQPEGEGLKEVVKLEDSKVSPEESQNKDEAPEKAVVAIELEKIEMESEKTGSLAEQQVSFELSESQSSALSTVEADASLENVEGADKNLQDIMTSQQSIVEEPQLSTSKVEVSEISSDSVFQTLSKDDNTEQFSDIEMESYEDLEKEGGQSEKIEPLHEREQSKVFEPESQVESEQPKDAEPRQILEKSDSPKDADLALAQQPDLSREGEIDQVNKPELSLDAEPSQKSEQFKDVEPKPLQEPELPNDAKLEEKQEPEPSKDPEPQVLQEPEQPQLEQSEEAEPEPMLLKDGKKLSLSMANIIEATELNPESIVSVETQLLEHFADIKSLSEQLALVETFPSFGSEVAVPILHEAVGEASVSLEKTEDSDYWLESETDYSVSEFEDEAVSFEKDESHFTGAAETTDQKRDAFRTASQRSTDNTDLSVSFHTDLDDYSDDHASDTRADISLQGATTESSDKLSDFEGDAAVEDSRLSPDPDFESLDTALDLALESGGLDQNLSKKMQDLDEKSPEMPADVVPLSQKPCELEGIKIQIDSGAEEPATKAITPKKTSTLADKKSLSVEAASITGLSDDDLTNVTPLDVTTGDSDKWSDFSDDTSIEEMFDDSKSFSLKAEEKNIPSGELKVPADVASTEVDSSVVIDHAVEVTAIKGATNEPDKSTEPIIQSDVLPQILDQPSDMIDKSEKEVPVVLDKPSDVKVISEKDTSTPAVSPEQPKDVVKKEAEAFLSGDFTLKTVEVDDISKASISTDVAVKNGEVSQPEMSLDVGSERESVGKKDVMTLGPEDSETLPSEVSGKVDAVQSDMLKDLSSNVNAVPPVPEKLEEMSSEVMKPVEVSAASLIDDLTSNEILAVPENQNIDSTTAHEEALLESTQDEEMQIMEDMGESPCDEEFYEDENYDDVYPEDEHNYEGQDIEYEEYPDLSEPFIINDDELVYPLQYEDWIEESFDLKEYGIEAVFSESETDVHDLYLRGEEDLQRAIDYNLSNYEDATEGTADDKTVNTESFKTLSNHTSKSRTSEKEHDSWSTADADSIEDDLAEHDKVLSKIDQLLAEDFSYEGDYYKDDDYLKGYGSEEFEKPFTPDMEGGETTPDIESYPEPLEESDKLLEAIPEAVEEDLVLEDSGNIMLPELAKVGEKSKDKGTIIEPSKVEEKVKEKTIEPSKVEEKVKEKTTEPSKVEEKVKEKISEPSKVEEKVKEKPEASKVEERVKEKISEDSKVEEKVKEKTIEASKVVEKVKEKTAEASKVMEKTTEPSKVEEKVKEKATEPSKVVEKVEEKTTETTKEPIGAKVDKSKEERETTKKPVKDVSKPEASQQKKPDISSPAEVPSKTEPTETKPEVRRRKRESISSNEDSSKSSDSDKTSTVKAAESKEEAELEVVSATVRRRKRPSVPTAEDSPKPPEESSSSFVARRRASRGISSEESQTTTLRVRKRSEESSAAKIDIPSERRESASTEDDTKPDIPEKTNKHRASLPKDTAPTLPPKKPKRKTSSSSSDSFSSLSSSTESLSAAYESVKTEDSKEGSSEIIPDVPNRKAKVKPFSTSRRDSSDDSSASSKLSSRSSGSWFKDTETYGKKRASIDEQMVKLQSEGKCASKEKAFIAAKLIEMQFEEQDALMASRQCSSVYHAVKFLTQLCELCNCRFPVNQMASMVHCTHRACKECLKAHFTTLINDRSIFTLLCPICHKPDITDQNIQEYFNHLDMMFRNILDSGTYDLFQRKLRDEVLTKDPNFHWCSQCSSGFIASPRLKKLYCPDCSAITCSSCHQTWELEHEGVHCERFQQWKDMHTPEPPPAGSVKFLADRGVTCLSCGIEYAQASAGCLMYKCSHCSFEFCGFCIKPYKRGRECGQKSCESLGIHAHHTYNCLFFLRDKDMSELQLLLEEENVTYLTIPPKDQIVKSRCQVREQKHAHGIASEDRCGRDIVPYCAGLCRTHYYEYLAELLRKHKINPLPVMTTQDLQFMFRKCRLFVPEKVKGETNDEYYNRLTKLVTSTLT